jgi:hypothetical protein
MADIVLFDLQFSISQILISYPKDIKIPLNHQCRNHYQETSLLSPKNKQQNNSTNHKRSILFFFLSCLDSFHPENIQLSEPISHMAEKKGKKKKKKKCRNEMIVL